MFIIILFFLQYVDYAIAPKKADCTKEYDNAAYWRNIEKHNRKMALSAVFKHRCRMEMNYSHIEQCALLRWIYSIKAFACLLLRRKARKQNGIWQGLTDPVTVCAWDFQSFFDGEASGERWTELYVGYGLFSNWRYAIEDNQSF